MNLSSEYLVYAKNTTSERMIGMLYYLYVNRLENSIVDSYSLTGIGFEKRWRSSQQTEQNSCLVEGKQIINGKWMEQSSLKRKSTINDHVKLTVTE